MLTDLKTTLGFSDADLALNRDGQLSPLQRRRLQRAMFWQNVGYWLMAVFFYVVALAIEPWAYTPTDGRFLAAVLIILMATGGLYYLLAESEAHTNAVKSGKVQAISGFVRCEYADHGRSFRAGGDFYIQIHDQRFYVPFRAFQAFEDGAKYTLYYLPVAYRVVSATPLAPSG